jgi:hypothetical protein
VEGRRDSNFQILIHKIQIKMIEEMRKRIEEFGSSARRAYSIKTRLWLYSNVFCKTSKRMGKKLDLGHIVREMVINNAKYKVLCILLNGDRKVAWNFSGYHPIEGETLGDFLERCGCDIYYSCYTKNGSEHKCLVCLVKQFPLKEGITSL